MIILFIDFIKNPTQYTHHLWSKLKGMIMLKHLVVTGALFCACSAMAEIKSFTDVMGREVSVDVPVKRAILTFYYPDYIAVAGVENFKHVVGISREFWEKFNPGSWGLYAEKIPDLVNITDVGYATNNNFSTEKALALNPDVLIVPKIQLGALESELPYFEKAGVPVVVVDFNDQTVENHRKSAEIFGILSGEEARAKKISDKYAAGIADIQARVAKANTTKPKIYVEFGNKGPSEHSFTFGKNMWGAIAKTVGGDNISAPYIESWGQLNPEQVISAQPEVIIITGTENNVKTAPEIMAMGIDITETEAKKRLAGFAARSGWAELPAVKNQRIYGLYHTASRSLSDLAAAQFMAKALYPEAFADIDPLKTYMDFHTDYLPITPKGTFFLSPKN